tara:strand:+ start:281 stop:586 length:306 start_codon:yes stop_codon:yes gene_type:complete
MKKTLAAIGELNIPRLEHKSQGEGATISAQGDTEDFLWHVEFTLDDGTTWSKIKDNVGDTDFTGSDVKYIALDSLTASDKQTRISVSDMGAATQVIVAYSL